MMQEISSVLFLAFIVGVCFAKNECGTMGDLSSVACVSWNEFKLTESAEDLVTFACPNGTFCANQVEVCVETGEPACPLEQICGKRSRFSATTCISQNNYESCRNGELTQNVETCETSKPYCSFRYNSIGIPNAFCTDIVEDMACNVIDPTDPSTTEPDTTEPGTTQSDATTESIVTEAPVTESSDTTHSSTSVPSTTELDTTMFVTTEPVTAESTADSIITDAGTTHHSSTEPATTVSDATYPGSTVTTTTVVSTVQSSSTKPTVPESSTTESYFTEITSAIPPSSTAPSTTPPSSTEPCATIPSTTVDPNICTKLGKFAITGDATFKRYYFCFIHRSGELTRLEFVCPYRTLYNPIKGKCVTDTGNFKCGKR